MFVSHHTLKWTRTCRSHGRHPHAHTAHFLLNRHRWHPAEGAEVRDDVLPQVRPVRVAVEAQRRDGDEKSVKRMRGVRYTVLKNPGKLTDRRSEASGNLRDTDPKGRPYRSWRLREPLRTPPKRPATRPGPN